jgi:hypothetical protein
MLECIGLSVQHTCIHSKVVSQLWREQLFRTHGPESLQRIKGGLSECRSLLLTVVKKLTSLRVTYLSKVSLSTLYSLISRIFWCRVSIMVRKQTGEKAEEKGSETTIPVSPSAKISNRGNDGDEDKVSSSGPALFLVMVGIALTVFLIALDTAIVATVSYSLPAGSGACFVDDFLLAGNSSHH